MNNKKIIKRCIVIVTTAILLVIGYATYNIMLEIEESKRARVYKIEEIIEIEETVVE
ncbi:MAG: hypothetical protein LUG60_04220 [Erysipelotrichaceae bacterium]|nr:hypothetical protein [Erysipelotrichaceae bacterium]